MKKTLVAIAALAATGAFAQSSVQLVGVIDGGYKTVTHSANALAKWSGIAANGNSTSQFNFKGTEDLGGGLKASFFNELDFNPTISNTANQSSSTASYSGTVFNGTPFTGQQFVALEGAFGAVQIGTPDSQLMYTNFVSSPFGTNLGGGWSSGFGRMGTASTSGANQYVGAEGSAGRVIRFEKTVNYSTPVINGFKATVEYSAQNANGGYTANDNGVLGLDLKYSQGPLNVAVNSTKASSGAIAAAGSASIAKLAGNTSAGNATTAAWYTANPLAANADVTWNFLAANYNFGATTVYGGYSTTKTSGLTANGVLEDSKSWNVAAKYVMGNIDLMANYLVRKSNLDSTQATTAAITGYNAQQKLVGLGANYNLSKNTFLYYRMERITGLNAIASTQTTATNGLAGAAAYGNASMTSNMVGLKMSF